MTNIRHVDCEKCGKEIGTDSYVICQDGITNRPVTFHHRCKPQMSDVRQHFGVTLAPAVFGLTTNGLA